MVFSYDRLRELAYVKRLNRAALRDKVGITNPTLASKIILTCFNGGAVKKYLKR